MRRSRVLPRGKLLGLVVGGHRLLGAAELAVEIGQRALGRRHAGPLALVGLQDLDSAASFQPERTSASRWIAPNSARWAMLPPIGVQMRHRLAEQARGLGVVASRMRGQAVRGRHRAVGPGLALERLGLLGAILEARQHLGDGARACRHAPAHRDIAGRGRATKCSCRRGLRGRARRRPSASPTSTPRNSSRASSETALIWSSENSFHTPQTRVSNSASASSVRSRSIRNSARCHQLWVYMKELQSSQVSAIDCEEGHALQHPPARLEAVRQRVVRPRIACAPSRSPCVRAPRPRRARLHSSSPKACMRPGEVIVRVGGEQVLADAQQRLGVAAG